MFTLTKENVYMFGYTNISELTPGNVRGIVFNFHGLGDGVHMESDIPKVKEYTDKNIGFCFPYCGPWNWMNPNSVKLCDEIVDLFIKELNLPSDIPVIPTGGSMGGLSSLVYSMESRHHIAGCAVSCPVCDLPYHYIERDDVPRTLRCAYGAYGDDLEETLRLHSPIHHIDKMPHVPYFIAHCAEDDDVHKAMHSDKFVPLMRAAGHDVTYIEVPDRGHCRLTPEVSQIYFEFPFNVLDSYS